MHSNSVILRSRSRATIYPISQIESDTVSTNKELTLDWGGLEAQYSPDTLKPDTEPLHPLLIGEYNYIFSTHYSVVWNTRSSSPYEVCTHSTYLQPVSLVCTIHTIPVAAVLQCLSGLAQHCEKSKSMRSRRFICWPRPFYLLPRLLGCMKTTMRESNVASGCNAVLIGVVIRI